MTVKVLNDGTTYIKAHAHDYEDPTCLLKGHCEIFIKADGIRAIRNKSGGVWSRSSKPLPHLDHLEFKDAEIFRNSWNETSSILGSIAPPSTPLTQENVYELSDGAVDKRLYIGWANNPSNENLEKLMLKQLELGHEGLVVRVRGKNGAWLWWKIVPYKYADVQVTGYKVGKGALAGVVGSIQTNKGSVGSFCDGCIPGVEGNLEVRKWLMQRINQMVANKAIIQVRYREITEAGKFRFPSLVRIRTDKNEESFD